MIPLLAFFSGTIVFHAFHYFPVSSIVLGTAALLWLGRRSRYAAIALLVLGVLYPALWHAGTTAEEPGSRVARVSGYFVSPGRELSGGYAQQFSIADVHGRGSSELIGQRVDVLTGKRFEVGRAQRLTLRLTVPPERRNPGAWPRRPYAVLAYARDKEELHTTPRVFFNRLRQRLGGHIDETFDPAVAALVKAVTTGQRSGMEQELREDFRRAGLAHLLSISGTHFGLLFLIVFGAFRFMVKRLPMGVLERLTLYLTPAQTAAVLSIPFMVLYLGLSGSRVPTVRSFVMISLFMLGLLLGRKGRWLNFLLIAAVVLVLWEPAVVFGVSFQLSFMAVLFIGFFLVESELHGFQKEDDEDAPRRPFAVRYLRRSGIVILAATLGVTPLIAYYFNYASVVSPLANFLVTPIIGFVLVPLSLLGSFAYLASGVFATAPLVDLLSGVSIKLVHMFANMPYAAADLPAFPPYLLVLYYGAFIFYWIRKNRLLIFVPFVPLVVYVSVALVSDRPLDVTFIDGGRAESAVIEAPDGKTVVVDAGGTGRDTIRYLRHRGVTGIEALVLTHPYRRHTNGAARIVESMEVKELWDNGRLTYPGNALGSVRRRELARGDVIEAEGYRMTVLHPYEEYYTARGGRRTALNNDSLVLRLEGQGISVLFAGEIEDDAMRDMMALGDVLRSDVAVVSSGKKNTAARRAFWHRVSPSVMVVEGKADENFRRGLPEAPEVYSTAIHGAVKVSGTTSGMVKIKTGLEHAGLRETSDVRGEWRNIRNLFTVW